LAGAESAFRSRQDDIGCRLCRNMGEY